MTEDTIKKSPEYLELSEKILSAIMEYSEKVSMFECATLLVKGGLILLACYEKGKPKEEVALIQEDFKKEIEEVVTKLGEFKHE